MSEQPGSLSLYTQFAPHVQSNLYSKSAPGHENTKEMHRKHLQNPALEKSAGPPGPTGCGEPLTKEISSVKQICKGIGIQVSWSSLYWCLRGLAPYCLVFLVEPRTRAFPSPADYLDFLGPPGYTLKSYPKSYPPQEEPTAPPDTLNEPPKTQQMSCLQTQHMSCLQTRGEGGQEV